MDRPFLPLWRGKALANANDKVEKAFDTVNDKLTNLTLRIDKIVKMSQT